MLIRTIDRTPTGSPLLCDAVLLTKEGEEISRKRIVYSVLDTDEMLLRLLNVTAKSKPHTLKLTLIVEWIDNKAIKYENKD